MSYLFTYWVGGMLIVISLIFLVRDVKPMLNKNYKLESGDVWGIGSSLGGIFLGIAILIMKILS